jgi:hypothetical protein
MTRTGAGTVGAYDAVAATYFATQRVGDAMRCRAGITRDHMTAMAQVLADAFSVAGLRLGKRTQGKQDGNDGQQLFHGYSSLVGMARPNARATVASPGRRIGCPMADKA